MSSTIEQNIRDDESSSSASIIQNFNTTTIIANIIFVLAITFCFIVFPDFSLTVAEGISTWVGDTFTSAILWWAFLTLGLAFYFTISKYGAIKMGEGSPDYSTIQYIVLMGFAGFGSGTMYWAFLEWAAYADSPARGLASQSVQAYEWAVPYAIHHWGLVGWGIFSVTAIPVMYYFYHKNINSLKLGDIIVHMSPNKRIGKIIGTALNTAYPTILIITLVTVPALGVPVLSGAMASAFGFTDGFILKATIITAIIVILAISCLLGLEKGLSRICSFGGYGLGLLLVFITMFGPTQFIMDTTTGAVGHWIQNFIAMSFYTDSIGGSGFSQSWTVFFWGYWATYIPLMAVFITKVSKGRTIRNILACSMIGGTAGLTLLFGVTSSFMMNMQLNDIVPVIDMLNDGQGTHAIALALGSLPLSGIAMTIFLFTTAMLLISTLDSAAFTMACNTQKTLDENANPSRILKIVWAAVLVLVPLALIATGASMQAIQSSIYVLVVPMAALGAYMCYCAVHVLQRDFGHLSRDEIEKMYLDAPAIESNILTPAVAD
ncbi:hypothetical protein DZ860_21650 [Vibrio sinensis]|uniref:BCCT family transporter n=1 Tax=Vibrio sinensis TaxID=2302434 RepID=A0A3A6QCY3_9VIBR|nr:BCCT family transporter [Vibrio sinensis]RJX65361.1 hypothetical protein DZ860_21650 [Vibrio sinensis]